MRNVVNFLMEEQLSEDNKWRVLMLYILWRGSVTEENLQKYLQHASLTDKTCIVRNLQMLGVPIMQEVCCLHVRTFTSKI